MHEHLDYYGVEDLATIVRINAGQAEDVDHAAGCRRDQAPSQPGTPRIANARLWWSRQRMRPANRTARSRRRSRTAALLMAEVDGEGLDKQDRRYLETLIRVSLRRRADRRRSPGGDNEPGRPTRLPATRWNRTIAVREQFVVRTPRGRVATSRAYRHLQVEPPKREVDGERSLFD